LVRGQLRRGFTVIRYNARGETDFGMRLSPKRRAPEKPYPVETTNRTTLVNDTTAAHPGQQDHTGSAAATEAAPVPLLTAQLDGTPAVDMALVPKAGSVQMLDQYVKTPGAATMLMPPVLQEALVQGTPWQRSIKLAQGSYVLVIDNSDRLGTSAPPARPAD